MILDYCFKEYCANYFNVVFRYFCGGSQSHQLAAFENAIIRVRNSLGRDFITFEYLSMKRLRELSWTIEDFVNWLLRGHIHFIICHVHQGMENSHWSVIDIYNELQRLRLHEGFPNGENLRCPIFCQDKMKYLELLSDVTMPTFAIPIARVADDDLMLGLLASAMDDKLCRWILKAPFTTNSQHFKRFVDSKDSARRHMNTVTKDLFVSSRPSCYEIPYMILQERVEENNEAKMVFLNRCFSHFVSGAAVCQSLDGFSGNDLIQFGYRVFEILAGHPQFIMDGLVRVDVFLSNPPTDDGGERHIVLNELESLDAGFCSASDSDEHRVYNFLESYWERRIHESVINICERARCE